MLPPSSLWQPWVPSEQRCSGLSLGSTGAMSSFLDGRTTSGSVRTSVQLPSASQKGLKSSLSNALIVLPPSPRPPVGKGPSAVGKLQAVASNLGLL